MKYSIKRQIMTAFVSMVAAIIVVFIVVNGGFLEKYYVTRKQAEFVNVYSALKAGDADGSLMSEGKNVELNRRAEKNNIEILVINNDFEPVYVNARDLTMLISQLSGYLYNKNTYKILEITDEYLLSTNWDPRNNTEYIEMWGRFESGDVFIMRSPLESIREAVKLFNQFIAVVGAFVIVVSILLAWYLARKITNPIMELAQISRKMANLDFETKYTSGGKNEIGVLGQSFNQMSEKLEQTISDLKNANYELQKDIEQKEQIESMRTEFLGNVSHELKTPIALIQGYAEGLKEGISDDPESREFYCDVIVDEAAKMNQMVKNLLTLNQLEFGEEEIHFERFDITALIRGVLQSQEIMIGQKEANVNFHYQESKEEAPVDLRKNTEHPVYVWADEFKVEQVVRNYFTNALNHLDGEKVVEIKITCADDVARISVFNTGTPIPETDVEHIWEKFYKVDKARTREYGGNGIGLSIVKAIMESFHKGYGVRNYDNGVEFWFELDTQ